MAGKMTKQPVSVEEGYFEEEQSTLVGGEEETLTLPIPDAFEGEDGESLLFPGGPTLDQVEEWRSRYKDIYLTEFDEGDVIIWRTLVRKEYKEIMKINGADSYYKEERICEKVVLYPKDFGFMSMAQGKAGIPTLVAELVMEKSGFQAKTGAMRL